MKPTSPIPDELRLVSPRQLAEAVGRSRSWVYNKISARELRVVRFDGVVRIRLRDAVEFINSRTQDNGGTS